MLVRCGLSSPVFTGPGVGPAARRLLGAVLQRTRERACLPFQSAFIQEKRSPKRAIIGHASLCQMAASCHKHLEAGWRQHGVFKTSELKTQGGKSQTARHGREFTVGQAVGAGALRSKVGFDIWTEPPGLESTTRIVTGEWTRHSDTDVGKLHAGLGGRQQTRPLHLHSGQYSVSQSNPIMR